MNNSIYIYIYIYIYVYMFYIFNSIYDKQQQPTRSHDLCNLRTLICRFDFFDQVHSFP